MKRELQISILILLLFDGITIRVYSQTIKEQLSNSIDIVVSKNGSGNFTTIQEAINAIPDYNPSRKVIYIENGTYFEKVVVPVSKTNITMIGEDMDSTILVYDDSPDKADTLWEYKTYTIRIDADDFWAMNMTFKNSVRSFSNALAVFSNGDRHIFTHCRLIGWKGTYFINLRSRNYFKDCFIEGVVDYIRGFGVAVFDSCQIHSARTDSYITYSATPMDYKFGLVFRNCDITPAFPLSGIALGKPWFDYARTVLIRCREFDGIMPIGWTNFSKMAATCYLGEYQCFGPGADTLNRRGGKQLTESEAEKYVLDTIFTLSTFPVDSIHATNEINAIYNKFLAEGKSYLPDYFLKAGRDTFPSYPDNDWQVRVDDDSLYSVIKRNSYKIMDSISGTYSVQNLLFDNTPVSGFDDSKTLYGIEIDDTITVPPVVAAITTNAVVDITYPDSLPGFTAIMISSKNKLNHKQYKIYNSQNSSYRNANLQYILYISKYDTIHIQPDVYEYSQSLPPGINTVSYFNPKLEITGSRAEITKPVSLPGTFKIKVIAIDTNYTSNYLIHFTQITSINNNIEFEDRVKIQNPFSEQLKIMLNMESPSTMVFSLYDLTGREVLKNEIPTLQSGKNTIYLNAEGLNEGIYFYTIKLNNRALTGKLIKSIY